ncbi:hypothetical protein A2U01_0097012, partial [Trifolium medium]|nr:hypothetical protein [Trifolium medium]
MALLSTVKADHPFSTNISPVPQSSASETLVLLQWALSNLVTHFSTLIAMTTTPIS